MNTRCCICGQSLSDRTEQLVLSRDFDRACLCMDCAHGLQELRRLANIGSPFYMSALRGFERKLSGESATHTGARYCARIFSQTRAIFQKATRSDLSAPHPADMKEAPPW